jgi:hypothetical protein
MRNISYQYCNGDSWLRHITDFSIPFDEFSRLNISCQKVFITENKISGLSFPEVANSIIILGLGYGIEILKQISWLNDKEIIYCGDIDTHGLAIISQMRSYFPQTQSIMMDMVTLDEFRELCTREDRPSNASLAYLTTAELQLYEKLLNNPEYKNLRLEQERISLKYVNIMSRGSFY